MAVPTYELQLSSNSAAKPISSVWAVVSDERVKTDISDITGGLDKIDALRPVKFKYIDDYCDCHDGVESDTYYYNFIAQEVEVFEPRFIRDHQITEEENPDYEYVKDTDGVIKTSKLGQKDAMYISVINQLITRIEILEAA